MEPRETACSLLHMLLRTAGQVAETHLVPTQHATCKVAIWKYFQLCKTYNGVSKNKEGELLVKQCRQQTQKQGKYLNKLIS